ncbi:myotubularin-related protein 3-like isoform X1 [Conger conger]|uniref:myotubularin-related protein 3-like isoform X1 n=1 Tax=Conger conger TaxID=82655 RepID=UPI002A5AE130|nr:myotubularin-related protein 3-like isoform X1 [Conger conger]XP_061119176.1 myotubularin-related protein 3-like isoform X1 [Conger conger]
MGARGEEGPQSPAQPQNACPRMPPVPEDSPQVPFLELQGEVTHFVGQAEDAVIAMSSYRLHIRFKESVVNVPLMLIESVECRDILHLHIVCKDCKVVRCQFSSAEQCQEWARRLAGVVHPPARLEDLFSFAFHACCADVGVGETVQQGYTCRPGDHVTSRFRNEVERMGFDTRGVWRISEINSKYRLCSSYPELLLVPGWITDAELENVAAFRSWKRFPTVVYRHRSSGAVIARCAQPEVSWWGWRNADDERLVQSIAKACAAGHRARKHTANGTATHQHGYQSQRHQDANTSVPYEHTNGSVPYEHTNGSVPYEHTNKSVYHEHTNGSVSHEYPNGNVLHEHTNGSVSHEYPNGNVLHEHTNGSVSHEYTNVSSFREHTSRSTSPEHTNGSVPHKHTKESVPQEHTSGGVPEEHTIVSVCYKHTNGSVSQEHTNGSVPHEHTNGSVSQEHTNRSASQEHTNGSVSQEHNNGSVSQEHNNGSASLEHNNGSASLEHNNGSVSLEHTNGSVSLEHNNGSVPHEHTNGSASQKHINRSVSQEHMNGTHSNGKVPNEYTNGALWSHSEFEVSVSRGSEGDCADTLPQKLLILDARSYAAAVANRAKGGGCECPEYYPNCEVMFMGMANIHTIRKSFQALRSLCTQMPDPANWLSALENTRWLQHLALLLKAALLVVTAVDRDRRPVLVHCSDGWDRTPQIVGLSKLLLDPFYRTIEGFQVLVETEWLDFGHKFGVRCGHGERAEDLNERCPVFLQWLDCVHQLHRQFPCSFQFNESFLVKLVQHTYSCLFGTFLCDSGRQRDEGRVQERTCSLWSLMRPGNRTFQNILYSPNSETVLRPVCHVRSLMLWSAVYLPSSLPTLPCDDSCAPSPCALSPGALEELRPASLPKTRSFETLPGQVGGTTAPNRRSSDPSLRDKRPGPSQECSTGPGQGQGQGPGQRGRRPSEETGDRRVAGLGFQEEEELKALEDEGAGPPVEECREAELSVAVGVAEGLMESVLQEAPEGDDEVTVEPKCPSEPSPTPPPPPPMTPPTYLPLGGLEGPEAQMCEGQVGVLERAPETSAAPEGPQALSTGALRTSTDRHTGITTETLTEEGGDRPGPPCLNAGPRRPTPSTPPRSPAPLCDGAPPQDGARGEQRAWPRAGPLRGPQDGLALPGDAVQLRLRQMEAGRQLQVHTLKRQVQELWNHLENRHGNGLPGDQQTCSSPDSDCSADSPCHTQTHAHLLSEPSWGRLEQQDAEVTQWYPDRLATNCHGCEGRFWLATRKHHCRGKQPVEEAWCLSARGLSAAPCRTCGNVFCASCCEQRASVPSCVCPTCRSALPPVDLELEKPITASSN